MGKKISITAFVLSLGFVIPLFSPLFSLVGLILGIVALVKAKGNPGSMKGLAIAAIVISVIGLIFFALGFIRGIFGAAAAEFTP